MLKIKQKYLKKNKNMTSLCFHHVQQNFKMKLNNGNEYFKIKLNKKVWEEKKSQCHLLDIHQEG